MRFSAWSKVLLAVGGGLTAVAAATALGADRPENSGPVGSVLIELRTLAPPNREWLEVARLDGRERAPLTAPPPSAGRFDRTPSWSPDSKAVAFRRSGSEGEGGRASLFVRRLDDPVPVRIVAASGLSGGTHIDPQIAWSRDSASIGFSTYLPCNGLRRSQAALFVVDVRTGEQTRLTLVPSPAPASIWPVYLYTQDWSPDSSRLLVVEEQFHSGGCRYLGDDLIGMHLFVVARDGSARTRIASARQIQSARWSPHGDRVAFMSMTVVNNRASCKLQVTDPHGRGPLLIPDSYAAICLPGDAPPPFTWSPNGREIFYITTEAAIRAVAVETGVRRTILQAGQVKCRSYCALRIEAVSKDGRFIAVLDERSLKRAVVSTDGKRSFPVAGPRAMRSGQEVSAFQVHLE